MTKTENGFAWTDDVAQEAMRRFLAGESAGRIAKTTGKAGARPSRNAVIGKVSRMGAQRSAESQKATQRLGNVSARAKPKMPINFQSEFGAPLTVHVAPTPVRYRCEPLPGSRCIGLLEVEPYHCRWMVEKDGAEVYCGADRDGAGSLCATHHGYAYYPAKVSEKEFHRSLRRYV